MIEEVNKVEIKIVGLISDEDELDQIQSIAKVFVYERRMKCFDYPLKEKNLMKKNYLNYKKTKNLNKIDYYRLSRLQVRGLV